MIKTGILFSKTIKTVFILCATALLGITAAFLFTTLPVSAVDTAEKSIDINLTLGSTISVRILDSTATSDLSLLSFDLTPTAAGVTSTKRAIVDVSTSNITGYKLYIEANGKDHNNQYTTDLVQGDTADSHVIPTSTTTTSNKNFWNYTNPLTSAATVVPAHGTPDKIGELMEPTYSAKSNVDINVGVDTTITSGAYNNQLLFTAIANAVSTDYTLNFNSNLPTGADPSTLQNFPANQSATAAASSYTFTIPSTTPTLTGYTFARYQNVDDSSETYSPGDTVTISATGVTGSKTLNAIWSNITYDIAFDSNAPSGSTATGTTATMTNLDYNTSYNLTTNGYSITGYSFQGWCTVAVTNPVAGSSDCTSASGTYYADGASVQGLSSVAGTEVTLYAMWTKLYTYTLNLNTNDGTSNKQILNYPTSGGTTDTSHQFTSLNTYAPSRAGYNFLGWATTTTGTSYVTSYTLNSSSASSTPTADGFPVTGDVYAQWEVAQCTANHICFKSNEPSGTVSGAMDDQTIVYITLETPYSTVDTTTLSSETTELTPYSPNWILAGYGFKGWNTKADGSGAMYGPNETITLTAEQQMSLGTRGIPLYAQWVASAGNMASWSGCSSLAQGNVTALTYDGSTYAVAKLADGKCWMIENIRTSTNAGTDKGASWTTTFSDRQYNLLNITSTNASPTSESDTTTQYQWKSYGGYYSWNSAINTTTSGDNRYYNYNTSTNTYTATGTARGICPTGWRLPRSYKGDDSTNDSYSDFRYLNNLLNGSWSSVSSSTASNNWRKYPNNFIFAGAWRETSSRNRGTGGNYYSSTSAASRISTYISEYDFYLGLNSSSVGVYNYDKFLGYSVRCVHD